MEGGRSAACVGDKVDVGGATAGRVAEVAVVELEDAFSAGLPMYVCAKDCAGAELADVCVPGRVESDWEAGPAVCWREVDGAGACARARVEWWQRYRLGRVGVECGGVRRRRLRPRCRRGLWESSAVPDRAWRNLDDRAELTSPPVGVAEVERPGSCLLDRDLAADFVGAMKSRVGAFVGVEWPVGVIDVYGEVVAAIDVVCDHGVAFALVAEHDDRKLAVPEHCLELVP